MDTQHTVVSAVRAVRPAVVQVVTRRMAYDNMWRPVPREGAGSGIVIDRRGFVLTNAHVVADARELRVSLPDGRTFDGRLVGSDTMSDLAVISITAAELPLAVLGNSDDLALGEQVVAIGNALGLAGGPTVTVGVVSATGRMIRAREGVVLYDLIQTDAAINPGNSGGPLINLAGEVIGINTAIVAFAQGIGFAIAANSAKPVAASLMTTGRMVRPWLGVTLTTVTPTVAAQYGIASKRGALILEVEPLGPAQQAGLSAGDVVLEVAGTTIRDDVDLRRELSRHHIGETITIGFLRGTQEGTATVTLREAPRR